MPVQHSITFLAKGWVGSEKEGFAQTVSCPAVTQQTVCYPPMYAATGTKAVDEPVLEGMALLCSIRGKNGSVTASCYHKKPQVDLPLIFTEVKPHE